MEVRKVNGFFIIFVIGYIGLSVVCASIMAYAQNSGIRSEERRVGKECRSRWSPYH